MNVHPFSVSRPQAPNGRADYLFPLAETAILFRVRRVIRNLWMWPGIRGRAGFIQRNFPYSAFLPELPQRRVDGDARQPGGKTGSFIEIGEVNESAHEGILHRVFRVLAIAGDPKRHPENHLRMTFTKHAERGTMTAFRGGYQFALAPSRKAAPRDCIFLFSSACTRQFNVHRFLLVPALDINAVPSSVLLFSHPLPDICRTIFQPHSASFATCQKLDCLSVCQSNFPQIQYDGRRAILKFEAHPQILDMLGLKPATQHENR